MPLSLPPLSKSHQEINSYNKDGQCFLSTGTHYFVAQDGGIDILGKVIWCSLVVNNNCQVLMVFCSLTFTVLWLIAGHVYNKMNLCCLFSSSSCILLVLSFPFPPPVCYWREYVWEYQMLAAFSLRFLTSAGLLLHRLTSAAVLERLIKINSDPKLVFSVTFITQDTGW